MSRTCDLVCCECLVGIWVGQESLGKWRIYYTDEDNAKLAYFLNEHEGHRLEFGNSDRVGNRWDYKRIDRAED